ncbi:hypothetical protein SPRG_11928 [Saprolegnia parasitica CBS 223.65]|uniref:Uncharacterized protein n=1 Tax=Saprolegnia parasitica (strain CBS 223.65) TaxID=695850 RepID=A0A067BX34_SAPPC|nr:hypothetical protein SPRG_11928 [Saprolegnia parasitica CBS 223.65]KDO23084.1 hypothetical protein SPRG_11928 [Saprolegnia parasitica CBS 223.65]|eukprot:XP_012206196.1 hypothetical protein SPRG_11928 [Saprolegnia parasitica CBS 223.65]
MTPRTDDARSMDAEADLDFLMQKNMRKLRMKAVAKKKSAMNVPTHPLTAHAFATISPKDKKREPKSHVLKKDFFAVDVPKPHATETSSPDEKRRNITIFECAKLFNDKGQVLTPQEFELGGSPCSMSPSPSSDYGSFGSLGRKSKKLHKKSLKTKPLTTSQMLREMAWEQLMLELMTALLPRIDVLSELNRNLVVSRSPGKPGHMDLVAFQQHLSARLLQLHTEETELPAPFTPAVKLVQMYINSSLVQHITYEFMKIKDARAIAAHTDILLAIYDTVPGLRFDILNAIEAVGIELYNLQATSPQGLSMEGVVNLLGHLVRFQHDLSVQSQENMFDDMDDEGPASNDDDMAVYESAKRSLSMFCRSWSLSTVSTNEKYPGDSSFSGSANLASNLTVKALVSTMTALTKASPHQGLDFLLSCLLRRWPARCTSRQLLFLRLLAVQLVTLASANVYLELFPKAVFDAFHRIRLCILSPHVLVAREAGGLCDDLQLQHLFLLRDKTLLNMVSSALHDNAKLHWNKQIQSLSDDRFDAMLDLA